MRWPTSLRSRLTLWYSVFLGLPLIALSLASYLVFARTLENRTDDFIGDALTAFTRELSAERRAALTAAEAMRTTVAEVRFRDLHIEIVDSVATAVAMTSPAGQGDADAVAMPRDMGRRVADALRGRRLTDSLALTIAAGGTRYRLLSRPLVLDGQRYAVTGTYSLADIEEMLGHLREMFLIAIPLLVLVAATGGYFLARKSLAPVSLMAAHAAKISATNLDERFPVAGGDELAGLARMVNDLLDRLERSFAEQRRFVADASHELRTPTAILRSEADVTLSRDHRDEAEYRASVGVIGDAARRLTRIVDDLFLLARADSGHLVARAEPLYQEELVDSAVRAVRSVAATREVQLELRPLIEAPFHGDPDLLGRLLLNLLDNAIKYSPAGGKVEVELRQGDGEYLVTVVDAGQGIPADVQDLIFERFYRVDTARKRRETTSTSGAGLGLSIARRIAEMHGGRLGARRVEAGANGVQAGVACERVIRARLTSPGEAPTIAAGRVRVHRPEPPVAPCCPQCLHRIARTDCSALRARSGCAPASVSGTAVQSTPIRRH